MEIAWWGMIPFVLMLLGIAVLPLHPATAKLWHKHRYQVLLSLLLGLPVLIWFLAAGQYFALAHTVHEYVQFIVLLFSLYVVSGGIYLRGDIRATPRNNTLFIGLGGIIASFVGTTGAAMLLIRPLLNINRERTKKLHTVLFTIYIAANCGGILTPLGDPPLFLGFIRGVPFTWTFRMFPEWILVNGILLVTYWALDKRYYASEPGYAVHRDETEIEPLGLDGKLNFLWFAVIIGAVAFAPTVDFHAIEEGHLSIQALLPLREIIMLIAAGASYWSGSKRTRFVDNEFNWGPILEVAAIFIGIFSTMMPALLYLEQIAPKIHLNRVTLYVFTGGISAFLDNAPTYATFFQMASQLPGDPRIANVPEAYLLSISLASVFFGAITYIGNGPNFMVKSVAESRGVQMPSFAGYIVRSFYYLFPALIVVGFLFVSGHGIAITIGATLYLVIILRSLIIALTAPDNPVFAHMKEKHKQRSLRHEQYKAARKSEGLQLQDTEIRKQERRQAKLSMYSARSARAAELALAGVPVDKIRAVSALIDPGYGNDPDPFLDIEAEEIITQDPQVIAEKIKQNIRQ